jgi:hypothetical protein
VKAMAGVGNKRITKDKELRWVLVESDQGVFLVRKE